LASRYERLKNATLLSGLWLARQTGYFTTTKKKTVGPKRGLLLHERPLLKTEDFRRLAEQIYNSPSAQHDLPSGILTTLDNLNTATLLRREHSKLIQLYAASQQEDLSEDDRNHEHFTRTLERCRDFTKATIERNTGVKRKTSPQAPPEGIDASALRFGLLTVEDAADFYSSLRPTHTSGPTTAGLKTAPTAEVELGLNEKNAFWMLLQQSQDLRDFVSGRWDDYIKGKISLYMVSKVRSIASQLDRLAVDEFLQEYPSSKHFEELSDHVSERLGDGVVSADELNGVACMASLKILLCIRKALLSPSHEETKEILRDCARLHPKASMIILAMYTLQQAAKERGGVDLDSSIEGLDPLIRGLETFLRTQEVTLYLTITLEMYLQMHDLPGYANDSHVRTLYEHAYRVVDVAERFEHNAAEQAERLGVEPGSLRSGRLSQLDAMAKSFMAIGDTAM